MNARIVPMAGKRFGRLLALRDIGRCASGDRKWNFRCDCGTEFAASGYDVRRGKIVTCPACSAQRTREASLRHGMTHSAEFRIWTGMLTRTTNANARSFPDYGGRGIRVCERWRDSFEAFYADMGPRPSAKHSVERRDNDGHYEPNNCYWATREQQGRNKRNNVRITIDGVTRTLAEWAELAGLTYETLYQRHLAGRTGSQLLVAGAELIRPKRSGAIEFNGVRDTYDGWSKRTGIKPSTIAMRIRHYGWPIARALTEGASS